MKGSNYLNWLRRLLVLGAVVAGMTAPAAGSATNPAGGHNTAIPDVIERYAAAHPYGTTSYPDWIERYAAAHPFGRGLLTSAPPTDCIVDDHLRDALDLSCPARRQVHHADLVHECDALSLATRAGEGHGEPGEPRVVTTLRNRRNKHISKTIEVTRG